MVIPTPSDVSPWISIGVPFLSGIAGATLGGAITWLTAGRKLAREKAAEHRLEWLEGMHDALVRVMLPIGRAFAQLTQKHPDHAVIVSSLTELTAAFDSAQTFRHRARLFASQEAVTAIRDAFEQLEDPITMPLLTETTPEEITRAVMQRIEAIGNVVMKAREDIVQDMRSHLDLPKLERRKLTMRDNAVRMGLLPPIVATSADR